jgi:hypothetical protein
MEAIWLVLGVLGLLLLLGKAAYDERMEELERQVRYRNGPKPTVDPATFVPGELPPPQHQRSVLVPPPSRPSIPTSSTNSSQAGRNHSSTTFEFRRSTTSDYEVSKEGFQPKDRCSCGGTWVKVVNSENGGRFFRCSRYPRCRNGREEVLKKRLGSRYRDFYCSRGHELAVFGTTTHPRNGKEVCNRCIYKGYVKDPSDIEPKQSSTESRKRSGRKSPTTGFVRNDEYCRNGHPRTPENTYYRPDGSRECRVCKRAAR